MDRHSVWLGSKHRMLHSQHGTEVLNNLIYIPMDSMTIQILLHRKYP